MAIQWADNFTRYGLGSGSNTAMLSGLPYSALDRGGSGGDCVRDPDLLLPDTARAFRVGFSGNYIDSFRIALPTPLIAGETIGMLARYWLSELPPGNNQRTCISEFCLLDPRDRRVRVVVEPNGALAAYSGFRSSDLVLVASTVVPVISPQSWNHIETVVDTGDGSGAVYVNGVQRLSWDADADVAGSVYITHINVTLSSNSGFPALYIKDFVIWDSTGSNNNTVMGTVIVRRLKPNGDNTLGGWTPSTGATGFNLLAKDAPNDATFLSGDDTPPAAMIFNLENLPPDITSVRGLLPVVRMRKIDGGDANVQNALSPNGIDWDTGADRPITTAFTYYFDVSELDPDTGLSWTPVSVDSTDIRINRTI